ncbi:MAG: YkgJ family cysteine cluster protein [Candidatus Methanomethylophilaceae archaeon]
MVNFNIDYSGVRGRLVECPPQCGMCCLCQPEVLPEEKPYFEKNHPESLVKTRSPYPYTALAMKKGRGSCVFLNGRRCKIYEHRPAYCRQFPIHIYAGEKISAELDLSCRGAWTGRGTDAETEAKKIAEAASGRIHKAFRESKKVYDEFYGNCMMAGVMGDPAALRGSISDSLYKFTDPGYLGAVLETSLTEDSMGLEKIRNFRPFGSETEETARAAAMDSMSAEDPLSLPVYCDSEWNWNMFRAGNGRIEWMVMDDDGDLESKDSSPASEIPLKPPEGDGKDVLAQYISVLNGRESFMGSVFSNMDAGGYEDSMSNSYYGTVAVSVLDLMWRASVLDHFMGTGTGAEGIREAVIFYDMDRLDAPSIGAFV